MKHVFDTAKRLFAASALALGAVGFALSGGAGHAVANPLPDTGTYDELVEVHGDDGVAPIADDDGLQADGVQKSAAWQPGLVTGH